MNRLSILSRLKDFLSRGQCNAAVYYTGALKAGLDCTGFLVYVICPGTIFVINSDQVPVVRMLDSTIHRINHYPVDKY